MSHLHIDLLLALKAAGQYGLPAETVLADLRRGRHRGVTLPQLEQALRELADQSLVTPFESPLSGKRWRITAVGASSLQEEGL